MDDLMIYNTILQNEKQQKNEWRPPPNVMKDLQQYLFGDQGTMRLTQEEKKTQKQKKLKRIKIENAVIKPVQLNGKNPYESVEDDVRSDTSTLSI